MIEQLIARWGSLGVVIGTFFEGETVLLMAGALAHKGLLWFPEVVVAAFVGSLIGDQLWFVVGKRLGARFLATRPQWRARAARVEPIVARWGDLFVVGFRFAWGLRTAAPFLLANAGYPWRRFALLNVLGAGIWAVAVASLGWVGGAGVQKVLGRAARWEEIVAALAAAGIGFALVRRFRRAKDAGDHAARART